MRIDIITLFPDMFGALQCSMMKRAQSAGHVAIHLHNPREFATDRHHTVDDTPFGGGAGMVLKPEPVFQCLQHVQALHEDKGWVVLTGPAGRRLDQSVVKQLSQHARLVVLCGHYEGVDERLCEAAVDEEISIGDYVLTGGELPAMVMVDAMVRLQPGVLSTESLHYESFTAGLLEFPQYTRPREWRGRDVPEVLLSGHHAAIDTWRHQQALLRTAQRRPDLLRDRVLTAQEQQWLTDATEQACHTSAER